MPERYPRGVSEQRAKREPIAARRWMAIGASTVVMFASYSLVVIGFGTDDYAFGGGMIGIGIGIVPVAFATLAVLSQRPRTIRTSLLASLIWFGVGAPIAVVDIPSGLVAGFGAGAVVALRRNPPDTTASRVVAVGVCTAYMLVLGLIIPAAALMVGAVLPFVGVGVADTIMEREAAARETAEDDEPARP